MFPSRFLTAADLAGQAYVMTVAAVRAEQIQQPGMPERTAYVCYFKGAQKGLVLCKTSAQQIAAVARSWGPSRRRSKSA